MREMREMREMRQMRQMRELISENTEKFGLMTKTVTKKTTYNNG